MTRINTPTNTDKIVRLKTLLAEALSETLTRDYHGTVAIEVSIQDGTIQHLRRRIERLEK